MAREQSDYTPRAPQTLQELDLPLGLIQDLFLRRLRRDGVATLSSLSNSLKLSVPVIERIFDDFRQRHVVEVKGMEGDDFRFHLTEAGDALAKSRLETSEYAGVAPVSLGEYTRVVQSQFKRMPANFAALSQAFSDIVLPKETLDLLGPALVSQDSLFLYGPTGGGKTTVAERLLRIYQDTVLIPHAVEVDSQIIVLFDPTVHHRKDHDTTEHDPRWVSCKRPCLAVGGELVSEMLDLRRDKGSGVFVAPLQMKANNGMLIIDDFGRQAIPADRLLNRWIVPLDRRIDYLTLNYGVKFDVPFELMVVFSTNIEPAELADEAFLRRIHNKVYLGPTSPDIFDEILRRVAAGRGLSVAPGIAELFRRVCIEKGPGELRACYPRDLCEILISASVYEGREPKLTADAVEKAARIYFTRRLSV